MDELVARIHSWLGRPRLETQHIMRYADLSLDISRRTAKRGDREIQLSQREVDLLLALMHNADRVISRERLLDLVWGDVYKRQE